MAYLKINNKDYSPYVNELKVNRAVNYNAQTNAAGDTVVEYINAKREIEVGIIPINDTFMKSLLVEVDKFNVTLSFRNPRTNALETINCIIPDSNVEYYTIQGGNVLYNGMSLKFIEL